MNTFISRQTMNNIFLTNSELNVRTLQNMKVSPNPFIMEGQQVFNIVGDGPFNVARFSLLKPLTDIHVYCAPRQDESSKPGVPKLLHLMACQTASLESCWEPLSQTNNDTKSLYIFFFFNFLHLHPPLIFPPILCSPLTGLTGLGFV